MKLLKVKLFSNSDRDLLEGCINEFLRAISFMKVIDIKFSSTDRAFEAMVIYEKELTQ